MHLSMHLGTFLHILGSTVLCCHSGHASVGIHSLMWGSGFLFNFGFDVGDEGLTLLPIQGFSSWAQVVLPLPKHWELHCSPYVVNDVALLSVC